MLFKIVSRVCLVHIHKYTYVAPDCFGPFLFLRDSEQLTVPLNFASFISINDCDIKVLRDNVAKHCNDSAVKYRYFDNFVGRMLQTIDDIDIPIDQQFYLVESAFVFR